MHDSKRRSDPRRRSVPALLLTLGAAAACGGGGAGTAPGEGGEDSSYAVETFGYVSPHPIGFHPLGTDSAMLDRSCELVLVATAAGSSTTSGRIEDFTSGTDSSTTAGLEFLLQNDREIFALTHGTVDSDGADELVLVQAQPGGGARLSVIEWTGTAFEVAGFRDLDLDRVDAIALGDFDGDSRHEIALVDGASARFFDDLEDGLVALGESDYAGTPGLKRTEIVALDWDRDGVDEVAVGYVGDEHQVRVLDDAGAQFAELLAPLPLNGALFNSDCHGLLLAADTNGDLYDELVVWTSDTVGFGGGDFSRLSVWAWSSTDGLANLASWSEAQPSSGTVPIGGYVPSMLADLVAFQVPGETREHLAIVRPVWSPGSFSPFPDTAYTQLVQRASTDDPGFDVEREFTLKSSSALDHSFRPSLVAGDIEGDGAEEVLACFLSDTGSTVAADLRRISTDGSGPSSQTIATSALNLIADSGRPLLALADFEGDGFLVRSTGVREERLGDPVPLVLLTAVPTKAGITQNYEESLSAYTQSQSSSEVQGMTSGGAVSIAGAVDLSIAYVGPSASRTIQTSSQAKNLESSIETQIAGYSAGHEADSIVFQGTLYESFEYEILTHPDPGAVGTYFTIDNPVDTTTFKWTVEKYDATFPELRIPEELLPHTIGDPTTYRSRAQVEALATVNVGWFDAEKKTVGEGTSFNLTGVDLTEEETYEHELNYSVTDQVGYRIGPVSASYSLETSTGRFFSVTTSDTTSFEGTVGDMAGADWDAWQFDFGMAVYTYGMPAGNPDAELTEIPIRVVTFWVDPNGSGY